MNIRNNQYGIFTISEFIKGMEVSNKLNLSKYINKSENSNKYVYFSIDRIQEDYIYFFDSQEENPKVFLQWDLMDDEDYQDCYGKNPPPRKIDCIGSFITLFREFLYQLIFIELEYSKDEYQDRLFADLDKIEWTKYYQNLFKDNVIESHAFRKYRRRFYEIIESIEEKEDKILTIDEFEWAFIDYLKEKGYTL